MNSVAVIANAEVLGGAELYLTNLYRRIGDTAAGTLVGCLPGWVDAGLPAVPVPVGPKWSRRNMIRSAARAPGETRDLVTAATELQPTWAHLQYKREQILLTSRLSRQVPVLWTEHGMPYRGRGSAALATAYRRAARSVATIVTVSPEVAAAVRDIVGPAVAVQVVNNPVDAERFRPPIDRAEREALRAEILPESWLDRPVAVVASRLHPAKRLDRVLALAASVGVPLLVVGVGPDRERLQELSAGGEVAFLGHRDDVDRVLRACDIYLFSGSRTGEGQPLAVLEAAATGLHLVGFRGDVGNSVILASGGNLVDEGGSLDRGIVSSGATGQAREYVIAHHSGGQWAAAYAEILTR